MTMEEKNPKPSTRCSAKTLSTHNRKNKMTPADLFFKAPKDDDDDDEEEEEKEKMMTMMK